MTIRRGFHILFRWLGGLLLVFLAALTWAYWHDQAGSGAPMGEKKTNDEDYLTAQIISSAIDTSVESRAALISDTDRHAGTPPTDPKTNPGYSPYHFTRDAHPKGHGCLLASFNVYDQIDSRFAYGVFGARKKQYESIIRFSSGNPRIQVDSKWNPLKWDVQGMAIKLFDVDGDKLMPGDEQGRTQDFLLMNNPVFFIRTLEEYAQLNRMLAADLGNPRAYFHQGLNPMHWHVRELILGSMAQKPRPESLMTTQFYSGSAYRLGPLQYVKYSMIPCRTNQPVADLKTGKLDSDAVTADYLRLELARQSENGGACFDFAVQAQVQGKNMPVEDTTVKWSEKDSPFIRLARVTVKMVENNTPKMNEQCENTSFNPWHTLPDHEPVGVMNRVRQQLYLAMSRFRQAKNCGGPLGSCNVGECNSMGKEDSACSIPKPATKPDQAAATQ